jgi:hypothetical protein
LIGISNSSKVVLWLQEIQSLISDYTSSLESRLPGLLTPNFEGNFRVFPHKEEDLLLLGVLHWYLPEEWKFLIRVWLENHELQVENKVQLGVILTDEIHSTLWLMSNYHERRFYSKVKTTWKQQLSSIAPIHCSEKTPIRTQRRRGYQDHGTLRPITKWVETSDWSFTELQNEIEKQRESIEDTTNFLRGWYE